MRILPIRFETRNKFAKYWIKVGPFFVSDVNLSKKKKGGGEGKAEMNAEMEEGFAEIFLTNRVRAKELINTSKMQLLLC